MKHNLFSAVLLLFVASSGLPVQAGSGETVSSELRLLRDVYQVDRKAFISQNLHMSESESARFWPIYEQYRVDVEKVGDGLVKLVLEYADQYPNLSDERATEMLKQYLNLEEKLVATRKSYFKKAAKALSSVKVLRWAQLENRMDLALRLQLAGSVPLADAQKP